MLTYRLCQKTWHNQNPHHAFKQKPREHPNLVNRAKRQESINQKSQFHTVINSMKSKKYTYNSKKRKKQFLLESNKITTYTDNLPLSHLKHN